MGVHAPGRVAVSVNQCLTTRSRPPGSRLPRPARPRPGLPVGWPARGPLPASSPGPGREDGSQAVAGPPGPLRVPSLAGQLEPRWEKPLAAPSAWTNTAASQDSGATALGPRLRARQPARSPTGLVGPEARPLAPAGDEASGGLEHRRSEGDGPCRIAGPGISHSRWGNRDSREGGHTARPPAWPGRAPARGLFLALAWPGPLKDTLLLGPSVSSRDKPEGCFPGVLLGTSRKRPRPDPLPRGPLPPPQHLPSAPIYDGKSRP
ncbi:translation initiation factor IF-2-like [Felis catus]|uniref:translation initiation factor IF-2-like n=1 Tax=Felis catus TaxID=9685 RepID=UPI001D1A0D61|nr:translation initiation factor IF-2-like [Felis catus]